MTAHIKKGHELKDLYSRLEKAKAERASASREKSEVIRKEKAANLKVQALQEEINELKKEEGLILSEHATLRYLERVELIPIDQVKEKIITDELVRLHNVLGNGTYPVGDTGVSVVIKNNVIITIV